MVDLALWGCGKIAKVRFTPLAGPYVYGPNRIVAARGGVYAAQSAPVMLVRGARARRVTPAPRSAWWHEVAAGGPDAVVTPREGGRSIELAWGAVVIEQRGGDLMLAVGASMDEAIRALRLTAEDIIAEADAYAARCDMMPDADPVLRSMVIHGVHAALSSIRQDSAGGFAGLAAGQAYSAPARTYYRDGYWTMQALLPLAPEAVKDEIRMLAAGVQPDGEAPSGVILSGPAQSQAWADFIRYPNRFPDRYREDHRRPSDWWSDHFDSPLFFILAIGDYVGATGDTAEAREHWPVVRPIVARYFGFAAGGALPLKPRNDRDWADNVYREGLVAYDLGLFVGALDVVATLGRTLDPALSEQAECGCRRGAEGDRRYALGGGAQWLCRLPDAGRLCRRSSRAGQPDPCPLRRDSRDKAKRLLLAVEASLEIAQQHRSALWRLGRSLRLSAVQAPRRPAREIGLCLSLPQRLRLALSGRRLRRGAIAPRIWAALVTHSLAGGRYVSPMAGLAPSNISRRRSAAARCFRRGAPCRRPSR